MFRRVLLGIGASAFAIIAGGCATQEGGTLSAARPTDSTTGLAQSASMANQGRFPAPTYSQEQQPAFALTGEPQPQSWTWAPASGYYQVGNARVFVPPSPQ